MADPCEETTFMGDTAPDDCVSPEFPRMTDDGLIWLVPRCEMQDKSFIVPRLAHDLNQLRREDEAVSSEALCGLGWRPAQLKSHMPDALDLAASTFTPSKHDAALAPAVL